MPSNKILVRPRQRHLKVMARHALVNYQGPRVARARKLEITDVRRWMWNVAKPILVQAMRPRQIVEDPKMPERLQISGQRQILVVPNPFWNGQQILIFK